MDTDPHARQVRGAFPVDQPMEALEADHHYVRQLFDSYLGTRDPNVRKDVGPQILLLLEMHTSLEEAVFYPRVRDVDPSLIDQCEREHDEAKQMVERLKILDETDPQTYELYRQLASAISRHVEREEQHLFPKVRQAGLDLGAIGLEMQAFEASMVDGGRREAGTPGMRQ